MKFKYVKAEYIYSFRKLYFEFKYKGTTLIIGRNEDQNTANGAGKTSLIKTLFYGLWGKELDKENLDLITFRGADDGLIVEVGFEDRGHEFKIVRYRDRKDKDPKTGVDFYINGVLFNGEGATETQRNIERKLKISPTLFLSAVLTKQGEDKHFLTVGDTEKKEIFSELLDLIVYSKAFDLVKDEIADLDDKISDANNKAEHFSERVKERQNEIKDLQHKEDSFEDEKLNLIKINENKISVFQEEIEKIKQLNSEVIKLKTKEQEILLAIVEKTSRKEELGKKLEEEPLFIEVNNEISAEVATARGQVEKVSDQLIEIERELKKNIQRVENPTKLDVKIKELKTSTNDVVDILPEIINKKEIVSKLVDSSIDVVKEFDNHADENLADLNRKKTMLLKVLGENKATLAAVQSKQQNLKIRLDNFKSLREEFRKIDREIQQLNEQSKTMNININKYSNVEPEIQAKNDLIADALKKIEEEKVKKNPYKDITASITKKIEDLVFLLEQNKKLVKVLEDDLRYLSFWKGAFSPLGIRSFIFDEVIDLLNQKVQNNLNELFEGALSVNFESESKNSKGTISNKINTKIYLSGKETTFGLLSGGEKRRAILAVNLALTEIAENYSGTVMNIKFLDEPFEGIDGNGQIQCFKLFSKLSQNKDGFFVISHDQSFQQLCPNAIYIVKKNGESKIVERGEFDPSSNSVGGLLIDYEE